MNSHINNSFQDIINIQNEILEILNNIPDPIIIKIIR